MLADFCESAWPLPHFQSLHPLPVCDWHPSSCYPACGFKGEWVCICTSSFFHCPNSHWVYSQNLCSFIFPDTGTLGFRVWPEAGLTCSQGVPLISIHHTRMWGCPFCLATFPPLHPQLAATTLISTHPDFLSSPLLPIWINTVSLNPWLSDICTVMGGGSW